MLENSKTTHRPFHRHQTVANATVDGNETKQRAAGLRRADQRAENSASAMMFADVS